MPVFVIIVLNLLALSLLYLSANLIVELKKIVPKDADITTKKKALFITWLFYFIAIACVAFLVAP